MISVIIPNYNNSAFIEACVLSCLGQAEVSQVLVIDDASTDDSLHLLRPLSTIHDKLVIIESSKTTPQGAAFCRNLGLQKASGKYISFLDSDDVYGANRFEKAIGLLESEPAIEGVYDNVWSYDESLEERRPLFDICMPITIASSKLFEHLILNGQTFISIIGLTLRASIAKQYKMDAALAIGEDSDYIWKIALHHTLIHSGGETSPIKRRIHSDNITKNEMLWNRSRAQLFKKWFHYSMEKHLNNKVALHFRRKQIHYEGQSKGVINIPFKLIKYTSSIFTYPKLFISLIK